LVESNDGYRIAKSHGGDSSRLSRKTKDSSRDRAITGVPGGRDSVAAARCQMLADADETQADSAAQTAFVRMLGGKVIQSFEFGPLEHGVLVRMCEIKCDHGMLTSHDDSSSGE
jgi:hypothetical protein